jgi:hypothetical protein
MARVHVTGGTISGGRIQQLTVRLAGLPARTLDRDAAIAWMRDGHSFIPLIDGREAAALFLVEVPDGDDVARFIRVDPAAEAADALPFGA